MNNSSIASLVVTVLLAGCAAPSTAPTYSQAPSAEPRDGMAVLYVYREYAEPTAWSPTISIDGKEVVSLPQQAFSWIYLSPGKHTLASEWPFIAGAPAVKFPANYVAGTRYFFEIRGTSGVTGTSPGARGGTTVHFTTTALVRSPQEREAVRQLEKCCRFIPPAAGAF